jgi:hypothetical protein
VAAILSKLTQQSCCWFKGVELLPLEVCASQQGAKTVSTVAKRTGSRHRIQLGIHLWYHCGQVMLIAKRHKISECSVDLVLFFRLGYPEIELFVDQPSCSEPYFLIGARRS